MSSHMQMSHGSLSVIRKIAYTHVQTRTYETFEKVYSPNNPHCEITIRHVKTVKFVRRYVKIIHERYSVPCPHLSINAEMDEDESNYEVPGQS